VDRGSSVGIATFSGDRVPVWVRFSTFIQTGPGAHPDSYTVGTGSLPGVKRPERGVDHPTPSSAKVKKKVNLYICFPSGPAWRVLGWTLPLLLLPQNVLDNVVGIATSYRLDGSGFQPQCGQEILAFPYLSRTTIEPTQPPVQWIPEPFPGRWAFGLFRLHIFYLFRGRRTSLLPLGLYLNANLGIRDPSILRKCSLKRF